jgi:hypothetical protein
MPVLRPPPKPAAYAVPPVRVMPKAAPKGPKKEDPAKALKVAAAKAAVAAFEHQLNVLHKMRQDWEAQFPEANQALENVKKQEDIVNQSINTAKPLVAEAKMSIGKFIAQRKWKKAHYDEEEILQILLGLEEAPQVFEEMLRAGILKKLVLDRETSIAWSAQNPAYGQLIEGAFKQDQEQETAVTVPKI